MLAPSCVRHCLCASLLLGLCLLALSAMRTIKAHHRDTSRPDETIA